MKEYACIIFDESTDKGEPVIIITSNKKDAQEICETMHPDKKFITATEVRDVGGYKV